ncbi:MAG: glycosyltransferase family 2 protein [Eubacteriales bacterium]|nr:glycosyltransferase family 2 protein [Eubacteriales bacterium]
MEHPLISIIIPVYNVEVYLHQSVDSVLAQTYTNIEVILIDDGSPDGCPAICDEYAGKDSRVVVIHQKNAGVSAARNAGLDIAEGEYISFIDSDDIVSPKYLEKLYALFSEENCLSMCSYERIFHFDEFKMPESCSEVTFSGKEAIKKIFTRNLQITAGGSFFKKEMIGKLRFDKTLKFSEDKLFLFEYILTNIEKAVTFSGEKHYGYLVRESSATEEKLKEPDASEVRAFGKMLCLTKEKFPEYLSYAQSAKKAADIKFLKSYYRSGLARDEKYSEIKSEVLCSGIDKTASLTMKVEFFALQLGDWAFAALVKAYYGLTSQKIRFKRSEKVLKIKL